MLLPYVQETERRSGCIIDFGKIPIWIGRVCWKRGREAWAFLFTKGCDIDAMGGGASRRAMPRAGWSPRTSSGGTAAYRGCGTAGDANLSFPAPQPYPHPALQPPSPPAHPSFREGAHRLLGKVARKFHLYPPNLPLSYSLTLFPSRSLHCDAWYF